MQIVIKVPKPRSDAARALANRLFHKRVVRDKKKYSRKGRAASTRNIEDSTGRTNGSYADRNRGYQMTQPHVLKIGSAHGVVFGGKVYVLKHRSSSRYQLAFPGGTIRFCCQDGCCDSGLQPDVLQLVEAAKSHGATEVVLRTGQRGCYVSEIAGLPVSDVSDHIGPVCEGVSIGRG